MAKTDRYAIEIETRKAQTSINGLKTAVKGFVAILAAKQIVDFGNKIRDSVKNFQTYENQLRLITKSSDDLNRVMGLLQKAAVDNRTAFGDTVDLFTKLRISTESLGIAEERVIDVTGKLSKALQLAGADGNTASSVIRQFGQAMASGEVRGDEFRSLVEGLGPALAIMARESGVTVGQLRRMSQAGELTAEAMFKMLENSKALTAAFADQKPTLDQLETALSDSFDRMLAKIAETSGATRAYESLIKNLTVTFNQLAGLETVRDMSPEKILEQVRQGAIKAEDAIKELNSRYLDLLDLGPLDLILRPGVAITDQLNGKNKELRETYKSLIEQIKQLEEAQQQRTQKAKEEAAAQKELDDALKAIIKPYENAIKKATEYSKLDFRTPIEKAKDNYELAIKTLESLQEAQQKLVGSGKDLENSTVSIEQEIRNAEKAVNGYKEALDKLTAETDTYENFYTNLIKASQDTVRETQFAKDALEQLSRDLQAGKIGPEIYAEAVESINRALGKVQKEAKKTTEEINRILSDAEDRKERAFEEVELHGLEGLKKKLREIELEEKRLAKEAEERIKTQFKDADEAELKKALEEIRKSANETIKSRQEAAKQLEDLIQQEKENQRTFEYGWEKAFEDYADNATNAAKQAQKIFEKTTQSMEDAIVSFAKTGKFEFKGFLNSILEDILRSQIRQLITGLFGGGQSGGSVILGGLKNILGFANGGIIPSNSPVLVGERGPELLAGAAGNRVTPTEGIGNNITYNINAVDALSFKQLVARDPQFINAVVEQGRRSVPQTRR
jgi:tape measure domain-containing protein